MIEMTKIVNVLLMTTLRYQTIYGLNIIVLVLMVAVPGAKLADLKTHDSLLPSSYLHM